MPNPEEWLESFKAAKDAAIAVKDEDRAKAIQKDIDAIRATGRQTATKTPADTPETPAE